MYKIAEFIAGVVGVVCIGGGMWLFDVLDEWLNKSRGA